MSFFPWAWTLFVDILWAAAVSYGAALVAQQFAKKPKQRVPDLGGWPIQTSQQGIPIPKVYGCERVAGNVIWMGPQGKYEKKMHVPHVDGHVRVLTYFKSFLIGISEGSGQIIKIWNGKDLIWARDGSGTNMNNDTQTVAVGPAPISDPEVTCEIGGYSGDARIYLSSGDGTQDSRFFTGESFGKYGNLIWAYFCNFETGVTPAIPNFSFEICTTAGYRYTYISEDGIIWGIPLFGTSIQSLDVDGVAVNVGGGVVGLPMIKTSFVAGDVIRITNTTNYNGEFTLLAGTTDKELRITDAYAAENFDGTEIIVKTIASVPTGAGRMTQDKAGNLYYAHINMGIVPNVYYVTKIEPDGTLSPDYEWLNIAWADVAADCLGIVLTPDGEFMYLLIRFPGATKYGYIYKINLLTGNEEWNSGQVAGTNSFPGYGMAIDSDGNAYGIGVTGSVVFKCASDDGTMTKIDLYKVDAGVLGGYVYEIHVDDSEEKVVVAGTQFDLKDQNPNNLYNMIIMNLDGSTQIPIQVGGWYEDGAFYRTPLIGSGHISIRGGFIYIFAWEDATTPTLYKYDFEGNEIKSAAVSPDGAGFYIDLSGNLVVVNQDAGVGQADILWFYDTDLNFISKIDNMFTSMLRTWDAVAGGAWIQGNAVFFPGISDGGDDDENPARMINDLAQNNRYGAGIAQDYINDASVLEEMAYWAGVLNLISLSLTEQRPLMDWVDFILSHCNGFRFWSEGQLHIGAFKDEAATFALTQDDLVRDPGDDPPPPVQVVKRKASEIANRIEINWIDRSKVYALSVAQAQDESDQRTSGRVKIKTADLGGIHNQAYAQAQAYRLLFESMYRFSIYSFRVSYKNMLLQVGDVGTLTDGHLLTTEKLRIIAREEDKDGRMIDIEAVEDVSWLYPDFTYATQQSLHVPDTPVGSDDLVTGTISFREDVDQPSLYLFFAPGDSDTDGALFYRSYDNINFEFVGRTAFDLVTLPNSVGTLTTSLPLANSVVHRYSESFTVDIGTVTSLREDFSDDEFFSRQSMALVGSEIIGWKNAEDLGGGLWRVSQLIRGMFGTAGQAHEISETFATVSLVDLWYDISNEEAGQTIYWKALATSGSNVSQTLADVASTAYTIVAEHQRPYPMSLVRVRDNVFGEVSGYPVTVDFNLPSKEAGFNLGGFGSGGWGDFVKDTRIVAVLVTLETQPGIEIVQELHSLDGYHADFYALEILEVDRLGNDPVRVLMQPSTSLPSIKQTNELVDII